LAQRQARVDPAPRDQGQTRAALQRERPAPSLRAGSRARRTAANDVRRGETASFGSALI
jgi:hypothetical protein